MIGASLRAKATAVRSDFAFSTRIRVRYSEVDPQSVVFNAHYLDYADIGITEYWRAVRAEGLMAETPEFHVARAEVDFRTPLRADEEIDICVRTARFGTTSMTNLVEIHGAGADDDLRAAIMLVAVHVDLSDHRPRPIPEAVRAALAQFDQGH